MKTICCIVFSLSIPFIISCSDIFKNRMKLNKAYSLYEKGKNEDDDKALEDITKTYQDIINQKIYAQERLGAVYRTLAERSLAKSQFGYAAQYFTEALKVLPNSPYLRYGLGISYANLAESSDNEEQKKDFINRAKNNFQFAISKDMGNPNYYAALASLIAVHEAKYEEALKLIDKALTMSPDNVNYLFILGRIEYGLNNYTKAIEAYRRIVNISKEPRLKQEAQININMLIGRK